MQTIQKAVLNPQQQQRRCRVCYEAALPLLSLCQCTGSIAYVHEDCILNWITKKMETTDVVEMPCCEICQTQYSASMNVGNKKICTEILFGKLKDLKVLEIIKTVLFILGTFVALFLLISNIFSIFTLSISVLFINILKTIIFPYFFIASAYSNLRNHKKLVEQSEIQIIEVTLLPKMIIK